MKKKDLSLVKQRRLDDKDFKECMNNIKNSICKTQNQIQEQMSRQKEMTLLGQMILEQQYMLLETLEKWEKIFEQNINGEDEKHD